MELEGTDLELSSRLKIIFLKKKEKNSVFCVVFSNMGSCDRWSVLHANEEWDWETSNTARNWHRQWTTLTSFDVAHCGQAAVKVDMF